MPWHWHAREQCTVLFASLLTFHLLVQKYYHIPFLSGHNRWLFHEAKQGSRYPKSQQHRYDIGGWAFRAKICLVYLLRARNRFGWGSNFALKKRISHLFPLTAEHREPISMRLSKRWRSDGAASTPYCSVHSAKGSVGSKWWVGPSPRNQTCTRGNIHFSLCAICSQQVGCHGSPSFSILCHSDTVIIWHFCPFLDVIRPHCSRSPSSSSTIYPSFHQQSLYPISLLLYVQNIDISFFW